MAVPGKRVRIAFGVNPTSGEPTVADWVNVTSWVRSIQIRFGRSQDLDRTEASTLVLELDNNDARFTPEQSSSPYYPNIRPFAQIEVAWTSDEAGPFTIGAARLGETDCTLFTTAPTNTSVFRGLVERWTPRWNTRLGGVCVVEAVDLFRFFQKSTVSGSYSQQTVGARIDQILTDIANPFPKEIDATGVTIAAETLTSSNALDYMREIAFEDGGLFYARGDGKIVFKSRATLRAESSFLTSQATIGDNAGELNYANLDLSMDEQVIVNNVKGKNSAGTSITAQQDTTSQTRYLTREFDFGTTRIVSLGDVEARAVVELVDKKSARLRVDDLAFNMQDSSLDSETLIERDLMHRVTINRRPDQGAALSSEYLIQGFEHDITPAGWTMRLRVSSPPADAWILGSSLLGTGTVLA